MQKLPLLFTAALGLWVAVAPGPVQAQVQAQGPAKVPAQAQAQPHSPTRQKLLPAQSSIGFVTRQMGVPVDGVFRAFDAQVAFDPKQPAAATINFTIDLGSASIGTTETEAELRKAEWFHTAKFPQATFRSSAVKVVGAGRYEVIGTLAIKGRSQPVTVPVTMVQTDGSPGTFPTITTVATGAFVLKRLDFQLGDGDWKDTSIVANEVQVKFKLTLTGIGAL
jgi:polyisoprenoid-binding protein YceI